MRNRPGFTKLARKIVVLPTGAQSSVRCTRGNVAISPVEAGAHRVEPGIVHLAAKATDFTFEGSTPPAEMTSVAIRVSAVRGCHREAHPQPGKPSTRGPRWWLSRYAPETRH